LPKDREVGAALIAAIPVPPNATFCGLLPALSFTSSVADREPNAAGVKVTEIVQVAPDANVEGAKGQLLVSE